MEFYQRCQPPPSTGAGPRLQTSEQGSQPRGLLPRLCPSRPKRKWLRSLSVILFKLPSALGEGFAGSTTGASSHIRSASYQSSVALPQVYPEARDADDKLSPRATFRPLQCHEAASKDRGAGLQVEHMVPGLHRRIRGLHPKSGGT